MRFAYSVKQKMKIAMLLFAVMACTILIRLLEDKSVKSMNESFVSMYKDRLVPATDLFYLAKNTYAKKSLLEEALYVRSQPNLDFSALTIQVSKYNATVDSLIKKYEKTFLVKQEKEYLTELKKRLFADAAVEDKILALIKSDLTTARKLYENIGLESSKNTMQQLSSLMLIQTKVGEELLKDSEFMVSGSKLYSAFQIALAIVIGVLIVGIVFTSNIGNISNEKFRLN